MVTARDPADSRVAPTDPAGVRCDFMRCSLAWVMMFPLCFSNLRRSAMLSLSVTLAIGLVCVLPAERASGHRLRLQAVGRIQTAWTKTRPARSPSDGRWRQSRFTATGRPQAGRYQAAQPAAKPANRRSRSSPPAASKPAVASLPAKPEALTPAQQLDLHAVEMRVIEHTNRQRARYGLRPLRVDFGLIRSARRHTQWMTRNHSLQHVGGRGGEHRHGAKFADRSLEHLDEFVWPSGQYS